MASGTTANGPPTDKACAHLVDRGWRLTRARRLTLESLAAAPGPLPVAGMAARLRGRIPVSSLYRTLALFTEEGVALRAHDGDGVARYELAEWLTGHHHHLVCVSCGRVEDLAVDPAAERQVHRLVTAAADGSGFRVRGHRLDIEGTCASCSTG